MTVNAIDINVADTFSLSEENEPKEIDDEWAYKFFQDFLNDCETALDFEHVTDEHISRFDEAVNDERFMAIWVRAYGEDSLRNLHALFDGDSAAGPSLEHIVHLKEALTELQSYYDKF